MIRTLLIALPLVGALAMPAAAEFPERALRIVHGFGAGGNADTVARVLAEEMTKAIGQPVVVESRPGAGGTVASDYVSKQDPDGYTMQLMVGGHAVAAGLYKELPYDSLKDFTFISTIGEFPFFVATQSGKYGSIQDLIEAAKAAPGSIKIGHSGTGTTQHLTGELLEMRTGADFLHIPYKGGAAAATALMSGEVDVLIDTGTVVQGQVAAGVFDMLAVSSENRWPDKPDVPSLAETVSPGFDVVSWTGIAMPAGVAPEIADRIRAEVHAALAKPEVQEKIVALGAAPAMSSGEDMSGLVARQIEIWTEVITGAGIEKL